MRQTLALLVRRLLPAGRPSIQPVQTTPRSQCLQRPLAALLGAITFSLCAGGAMAQAPSYPVKPIRLIIGYPPGGLTDLFARSLGAELQKRLGQPVVIDNRPGASQIIGADACAKAPADGYTFCFIGTETHSLNPHLFKALPYDPAKDIVPVAPLFYLPEGLMVDANLNVASVPELVALMKRKPDALNYASFGAGSSLNLYMEWFKQKTGTKAVHVPYKGGAQMIQALLTGETHIVHFAMANVLEYLRAGKLKLLAVSTPQRLPAFPDVPTMAQEGFAGWPMRPWFGVGAPAGTPKDIVLRINQEVNRILVQPEFREARLTSQVLEGMAMDPSQFASFIATDRANAETVVRMSGVTPQ